MLAGLGEGIDMALRICVALRILGNSVEEGELLGSG